MYPAMEPDLKEAERLATGLLRQVSGILDKNQRVYALSQKLKRLPAEMILEVMRIVFERAQERIPLYQDGFRDFSDIRRLSRHIGYAKMSEVYTLARRKDYQHLVRFMSSIPPAKRVVDENEPYEDQHLREVTLGEKKSLARSRDRDFINRILHDQHPDVIHNLLQNPYLTIKEVIKIASKRPTNQHVLWKVYRNTHWINYYSVKKALVNNPYSPPQISLSLLHFMLEQDLAEVAESQELHPKLQEAAQELLQKRQEERSGNDQEH
jgi:hypothetical protein